MTDLAELKALEPPIVIANRLRSRAAVYTEEGRHNAWGQLMLDAEATIISLIERVERAEAHVERLQSAVGGSSLAGYQRGMEDAAKVAETHRAKSDEVFDGVISRGRKGERNLELAAATAAGMSHEARRIAQAIRAKAKGV